MSHLPPPETLTVDSEKLHCDGGSGALGHPRVFLTMKDGKVDCPYCGRRYVLSAHAASHGASH